ncbi:MAG TPA: AlpA family phage regulatory protein [Steroidobacteraceae bacterium]|nr:AlpA family phage regulatory protein [Steroidobacteraceae bacterium]
MPLLTLRQTLELTGLGRTRYYELRAEGRFPAAVKIGLMTMHRESDIKEWLRENAPHKVAA